MTTSTLPAALVAVVEGNHTNPHEVLGRHGAVVRIGQPGAAGVRVDGGDAEVLHPAGLFAAKPSGDGPHTFVVVRPDGSETAPLHDPYRFLPTLGDLDLHLLGMGDHRRLWDALGARPMVHDGVRGTAFSV